MGNDMRLRYARVLCIAMVVSFAAYRVPAADTTGIQKLCGEGTPLRKGDRISFIGDSITMQGGYVNLMTRAVQASKATADLGVELLKHGLNGGRTDTILTGVTPWGKQDSYENLLVKDRPNVVVLLLGVNDVNQGNAVGPEAFEKNLDALVEAARKTGAAVVLATPAVSGERHDGTNPADRKMDQYAAISRKVAEARNVTLCDVRAAFIDYLKSNNPDNKAKSVLTYDGIHMGPKGNELLAECLSAAIAESLKNRGPRVVEESGPALIPRPAALTMGQGALQLTKDSRIVAAEAGLAPLARVLSDEIFTVTGIRLAPAEGQPNAGDISLQLDPTLKDEAYRIEVAGSAVVKGNNAHAVAFASVTLLQALQTDGGGFSVPKLTMDDRPAFPFRAALIDLARKYHTPGGIEQVIELCRLYKIRYLHLHLTDDQLFMFPSTKFPRRAKATTSSRALNRPRSRASSHTRSRSSGTWNGSLRTAASISFRNSIYLDTPDAL